MNQRIYYYDFLNIIACIAVLALHHNGIVHTFQATSNWNQALFIEVICYFAVPIFFMLSGATLMEYRNRYTTYTFFINRIKRTFIPFFIWSLFWGILNCYWNKEIPSFLSFIYKIFHTEHQGTYWFFIPLFGIYLLLPVISKLKDERKILLYICLLLFLTEGVLMLLYNIYKLSPIGGYSTLAGPLLFFISGYLISTTQKKNQQTTIGHIFCFLFIYTLLHYL